MTRSITLHPDHVRRLIAERTAAADHVRGVQATLRSLGIRGLADELGEGLRALGRMGDMHRAMVRASNEGVTIEAALRAVEAERARRRVA